MKTLKNQLRFLSIILSVLVILQSCTVYKSTSVSLSEASKHRMKTKIITHNNLRLTFKNIQYVDSAYFGVKKKKRTFETIKLNPKHIKSVHLKDKTVSTILTVAIPIGIITVAALVFQDSFKWKNSSGIDFGY